MLDPLVVVMPSPSSPNEGCVERDECVDAKRQSWTNGGKKEARSGGLYTRRLTVVGLVNEPEDAHELALK